MNDSSARHDGPDAPPAETVGGALARVVGDVAEFGASVWGRHAIVRHADPDRGTGDGAFDDVWCITALDELLASAVRRPTIRLLTDGVPVPPTEYTTNVRLGGRDIDDVVDPTKVAELFGAGASVVAQSLHRTHSTVKRFVEDLAEEVSHPLQANSYLTPPGGVGLAPHADRHDVFVIQISGTKRWTVDGVGDLDLEPGDTMYVPAGVRHSAASMESTSLHLTIGVLSVTYRSVLERLLRNGPAVLDRPLPLDYRHGDRPMDAEFDDMISDVMGHLRDVDAAAVAGFERERRIKRPPRSGSLVATIETAALFGETHIRLAGADCTIATLDGRCEFVVDGSSMTAPASCENAFKQLSDGEAIRVADLLGLDAPSQVIVARRLVTAGLCAICDVQ